MSRGYVVAEVDVEGRPESGTAEARLTIDRSCGCERLEQRVLRFSPGRSEEREPGERQEVPYVAAGRGALHVDGEVLSTGRLVLQGKASELLQHEDLRKAYLGR